MPVQKTISKQRQIISLMSEIITEHIKGDWWFVVHPKLDGTKDPTGCENVLLYWDVLSYVRETAENDHK